MSGNTYFKDLLFDSSTDCALILNKKDFIIVITTVDDSGRMINSSQGHLEYLMEISAWIVNTLIYRLPFTKADVPDNQNMCFNDLNPAGWKMFAVRKPFVAAKIQGLNALNSYIHEID